MSLTSLVGSRGKRPLYLRHAARTAAVTTLAAAIGYVAVCLAVNVVATHRLDSDADHRLDNAIESYFETSEAPTNVLQLQSAPAAGGAAEKTDLDNAPVFVWIVSHDGSVVATSPGAPALPKRSWVDEQLQTLTFDNRTFLTEAEAPRSTPEAEEDESSSVPVPTGGMIVAATSTANLGSTGSALIFAEWLISPFLLGIIFAVSLLVGARTAAPVEDMRRKQLDFTADASHELRTPVSIIEAEVQLALRTPRDAEEYRSALERIAEESGRMRAIVDDLLWLARFDAMPKAPRSEPVDIGLLARGSCERFNSVASEAGVSLVFDGTGPSDAFVLIPAEWADKLIGVLMDNACRHAGDHGTVTVTVGRGAGEVRLEVVDTGRGISPEQVHRIFQRFQRDTAEREGSGLGLAIADAVVRSTGGRWDVGNSPEGGASFAVKWPLHRLTE